MVTDVRYPLLQAHGFFDAPQPLQLTLQPVQRVHHCQVKVAVFLEELLALLERHTAVALPSATARQRAKEHTSALSQHVATSLESGGMCLLGTEHRFYIPHQLFQANVAQANAKVAGRYVFQLMSLVKDDRFR